MKVRAGCVAKTARGQVKMTINIPFPPATGNHSNGLNGKRFFTKKPILMYRLRIKSCLVAARFAASDMFVNPVKVIVRIYPPDRRRRDSGNIIKVVYDALTRAGFWADDSLVKEEHIYWGEPFNGGYINLEVTDAVSVPCCAEA